MKKYIWISIVLLAFAILSCGARHSNVESTREKKTDKTEISAIEQTSTNKVENSSTKIENSSTTEISEVKKEAVKTEESKEQNSQKSTTENSGKSLKKKTYFSNGTLKSETEYTENFSKIESENANLKTQLSTQTGLVTDLKSSNTSLQRINEIQKSTIQEERTKNSKFESEITELKKSKDKKTEREPYPWYWIVLGTILIWKLLEFGFKKAFPGFSLFKKYTS